MRRDHRRDLKEVFDGKSELLVVVVKGHYLIDVLLNKMLSRVLPKSNHLDLKRMAFILKFDFLASVGVVRGEVRQLVDVVNSVRNKFAHDPYFEICDAEALRIKSKLRNMDLQMLPDGFYSDASGGDVVVNVFSALYINLSFCFDGYLVRMVEAKVSNEMAREAVSGVRVGGGVSVDQEFRSRVNALLESDMDYAGQGFGK